MTIADIEARFTYHAPKGDQPKRYQEIRDAAKEFARLLHEYCPESREKRIAIGKLEECVMWASASIARNEVKGFVIAQEG